MKSCIQEDRRYVFSDKDPSLVAPQVIFSMEQLLRDIFLVVVKTLLQCIILESRWTLFLVI